MSDNNSLLSRFNNYITENHRKRNEESNALTDDVPGMGKHFTKKILSENPNIPQDDVKDYVNNVKDDASDYFMGAGMSAPAVSIGTNLEGMAAKLPEASRFRELLDNPMVQKIREPFKQQRNMDLMNRSTQEMADIARSTAPAPTKAMPMIDEVAQHKAYKNWLSDKAAHDSELAYHNAQGEIQDAVINHNKSSGFDPLSDKTQPAIPQELIDAIIKRKQSGG